MILGDCLDVMPTLPKAGVDMVFADFPYAQGNAQYTKNKWDIRFPINNAMLLINQTVKPQAVRAFTCGDKLGAVLAADNMNMFRYTLVWEKPRASLYFHANKRPLCAHELIQIFGRHPMTYNSQMTTGAPYVHKNTNSHKSTTQHATKRTPISNSGTRFPRSVIKVPPDNIAKKGIHPTQKPVALLDWLIRTYSNSGDNVLDPCSGSGTTAVAALACGRNVTCIEKDEAYFEASVERVRKAVVDGGIDATIEVRR